MPELLVDGFRVKFADGWTVGKFDDWTFYNKHFIKIREGLKAVDLIAVGPERVAYLIEFKDYRGRKREKAENIEAEFIDKTLFTLAALLPARCNARNNKELSLALQVLHATNIKLVLHFDQSKPGNKLFPPIAVVALLTQKLRNKLRSIDPHLRVCNSEAMSGLPWTLE